MDLRSVPRMFVDGPLEAGTVGLRAEDVRHLFRSLRARAGDVVSVADGRGDLAIGRLLDERDGAVEVSGDIRHQVRPSPCVSVAMAPPKGDRLAWAVQKLTEIGVDELVLLRAERSVREWSGDRAGRALERVRTIARQASMQSRRVFLPDVVGPADVGEAALFNLGPVVALHPTATATLSAALPPDAERVRLLVGPEGGFTEGEMERARDAGVLVSNVGPSVLRTETAAVVGAVLVLATYGRLG